MKAERPSRHNRLPFQAAREIGCNRRDIEDFSTGRPNRWQKEQGQFRCKAHIEIDNGQLLGWIQRGGLPQQAKPRIIDQNFRLDTQSFKFTDDAAGERFKRCAAARD